MPEEIPEEDWINELVRPIESKDAELAIAARSELLAVPSAEASAREKQNLARRYKELNRAPARRRIFLYWGVIAVALVLAIAVGLPHYVRLSGLRSFVSGFTGPSSTGSIWNFDPIGETTRTLSKEEKFYVFGDQSTWDPAARALDLWQAHPDDAWLFQDYLNQLDEPPHDMLEHATRIDPDNAFYYYVAAGAQSEHAVEKVRRPYTGPPDENPKLVDWNITDETAYDEAWGLLQQGIAKPRMEEYHGVLLKKRLDIIPPEHDLESRIARVTFSAGTSTRTVFDYMHASELVASRAFFLGEAEDRAGLESLIPQAQKFCLQLADQDGALIRQLVAMAGAVHIHKSLAEACEKCGLEEHAAHSRERVSKIEAIRTKEEDPNYGYIKTRGDVLAALVAPAADRLGVPAPTLEELKPGRMMNFAYFDRVMVLMACYNFTLLLVALTIFPFLRPKLLRFLGVRFAALLDMRDWLWILGLGILAPLLWYLVLIHLTPIGMRDWALMHSLGQPMALQASCTLSLMVLAPLAATRWRIKTIAPCLGFEVGRSDPSLVFAVLLAITVPFSGIWQRLSGGLLPIYAGGGVLVVSNIWLIVLVLRVLFGKRHRAPARIAVARVLAPVFALASLIMVALFPLTIWAERYWIARDEVLRSSAENYGMGMIEGKASRSVRERLVAALTEDGN